MNTNLHVRSEPQGFIQVRYFHVQFVNALSPMDWEALFRTPCNNVTLFQHGHGPAALENTIW